MPSGATPGTAYDRSGNGNHGKYWNATGTAPVVGKLGQALSFDGSNDFVSTPQTSGSLAVDTLTISAWVKPGTISGDQFITNLSTYGHYRLMRIGSNIRWYWSGGGFHDTTNANLVPGSWYHIVGTFSHATTPNQINIYINGILSLAETETVAAGVLDGQVYIGTSESISDFFSGTIDDVRVYNRALSADEVKRLYNMGGGR
jgi:hypothetical protein